MKRIDLVLLSIALLLAILPLLLPLPGGSKKPFSGADDRSQEMIVASSPDYRPWFRPLWKPPSGEIESLLFALQGALGAGMLGYYIGLRRGQSQRQKRERDSLDAGD